MQNISLRSTWLSVAVFAACASMLMSCAVRPIPPGPSPAPNAAEILKDGRMANLLGQWKLIRIAPDGHAPANPGEDRTILFANGVAYTDLWEHRLTYDYRFLDDTHLQLTWTASTNSNDKVGAVLTYPFVITGTELTLGGDVYEFVNKRATSTPVAPTATPITGTIGTQSYHNPDATLEPGVITTTLGQSFTLGVGQSVQFNDMPLRVKFLRVPGDSRCPSKVNCAWTGAADVEVKLTFATDLGQIVTFDTNPAPTLTKMRIDTGGVRIELLVLNPYPEYPEPAIEQRAYRATFVVSRLYR